MNMISLFMVGAGTLSSKWYVQPSFAPSKPGNNAGTLASGKFCRKRWEEQHPQAAQALRQLADAHAQQDPTFRTGCVFFATTPPTLVFQSPSQL